MNAPQQHTAHREDTIAALATPPGVAGLAVLRMSGPEALRIAAEVFRGADPRAADSHRLLYGRVVDAAGEMLDEVLLAVFRSPHSYTGEDSVEISTHGGTAVSAAVLQCLLACGARQAEPGEFTRRAFLHGKMDLAQAEAVADVIHAQHDAARRASTRQLEGALSRSVAAMRDALLHCAGLLELGLDFVEEDVEFLNTGQLHAEIDATRTHIAAVLATHANGRLLREGVRVALLGAPNVGKSSLLNALLGMRRAIVTDVPGTTRDYLEEQALLRGRLFRFVDTAGVRDTDDPVEREGIALTRELAARADVLCGIVDAERASGDLDVLRGFADDAGAVFLPLFNKVDLLDTGAHAVPDGVLAVSALRGDGLPALELRLVDIADTLARPSEAGEVLVTNERHAGCLRRALEALDRAEHALNEGKTEEFLALELREAIDALGEIIGVVRTDDILDGIFSRFCIGK